MLRQIGLLGLAALPVLGCAKGEEIAPGDVVIFTLEPADAGVDAASTPRASTPRENELGAAGAGGMATTGSGPELTPSAAMVSAQPAAGNAGAASAPGDAGTNDAGRSEDRPVDAGN